MSNGRNMHSMEFPLGDMLMMMEAMRLKGNTAMMSSRRDAEVRLREYQARFEALIPPHARHFDSMVLCEINMALSQASDFYVYIARPFGSHRWWNREVGILTVRVGKKEWSTKKSDIKIGDETYNGIVDLLNELAPMDCKAHLLDRREHPETS